VEQLRAAVGSGRIREPVVVVLEGEARAGASSSPDDSLTVLHAGGSGDDMLVDQVASTSGQNVTLVTADRELRRRAEALGAEVVGPKWLLELLEPSR
jgi:rRNA-processing protein FCF1